MNLKRLTDPLRKLAHGGIQRAGGAVGMISLEVVIGIAAFYCGTFDKYLPWWGALAFIVVTTVGGFAALQFFKQQKYLPSLYIYAALSAAYYAVTQPVSVLWAAGLIGVAAGGFLGWRLFPRPFKPLGALRAVALGLVAAVVIFAIVFILALLFGFALTATGEFAARTRLVLPLVTAVAMWLAIVACDRLQPIGTPSKNWLVAPVTGCLWCFFWWPFNPGLDALIMVGTTAAISLIAYLSRPWSGRHTQVVAFLAERRLFKRFMSRSVGKPAARSWTLIGASTIATIAFVGVFAFANTHSWWKQYSAANVLQVDYLDQSPVTANLNLVPKNAALDYCAGSNQSNFTDLGAPNKVVASMPAADGTMVRTATWACLSHPHQLPLLGYLFNPLKATGGCGQLIVIDASRIERTGWVAPVEFVLCDESPLLESATIARHWGSKIYPPVPAPDRYNQWHLLFPVTTTRMHWFTMQEVPTGVVSVTPDGAIQSMFLEEARSTFPGAAIVPDALVRRYLTAWSQDRDLLAKYGATSNDLFELSERLQPGESSVYPIWQPVGSGQSMEGIVPLEPLGQNQNAAVLIAYMDPMTLSAHIVDVRHQGLVGPRMITLNTAASGTAKFGPYTGSKLVLVGQAVGQDHKVNWVMAMELPPERQPQFHGLAGAVVAPGHGGGTPDFVTSGVDIDHYLSTPHE